MAESIAETAAGEKGGKDRDAKEKVTGRRKAVILKSRIELREVTTSLAGVFCAVAV
jgi:hypothetical protein